MWEYSVEKRDTSNNEKESRGTVKYEQEGVEDDKDIKNSGFGYQLLLTRVVGARRLEIVRGEVPPTMLYSY